MQILHINCNYIGTALHQTMVSHLDAIGVKNQVFVPTYDVNVSSINPNSNVMVSECFRKWDRILFDYKQRKICSKVQDAYDVRSFDCIHAYTLFSDGNCAMRLSEKYDVPFVVAVRNTDVNTFLKYMVHLRSRGVEIFRKASAIFFLSQAYYDQVFEKYIPRQYEEELKKKSYIIPNGIDDFWIENVAAHPIFDRYQRILDKRVRLLYAGRIDKNKNIPGFFAAAALLREWGWNATVTVVGNVKDVQIQRKIVQTPYATYWPACKKEELIKQYRNHDIFVMPSFTETFGLVYAEAMSQGLPVVYTEGQGFDGQFPEGKVGYHVNANDPQSIAEAIISITERYEEITSNLGSCVSKFRWGRICEEYFEIYSKIISGHA